MLMPTLQEFFLAVQAATVVGSVARDMVRNAQRDLAAIDVAEHAPIAVANAGEYIRLLSAVRHNPDAAVQTAINQAAGALGLSDAGTRVDNLIALATAYRDAPRTTKAELDAAANDVLAAIPKAVAVF
jgi:hypothetical protein